MSVVLSVEDVGPCRKALTIEIPAPAVDAEEERVVKEYRRRAQLPGFRPGKVPVKVVRERYRESIDQDVVERLLPRYWRQAEAEAGIDPLLQPQVTEAPERNEDGALVFTAQVETRPEIELRNIEDFALPDPSAAAEDDEIDAVLGRMRREAGTWSEVDRPAGEGDKVTARVTEVTDLAEGEEPPEGEEVDVEIGNPHLWEELSLALTGLAAGQKGDFTRTEDAEDEEDEPAAADGETAAETAAEASEGGEGASGPTERRFLVEALKVEERELAELDDTFAASVGPFETVEALRTAIRERIESDKAERRREERETALLDQLRERHPMELPQGVVKAETERLMEDYARSLARQGVDLQTAGLDWQALGQQVQPMAEKRVHARLILDAIARQREITVSEAEFEALLTRLAAGQNMSSGALRKALDDDGRLANLRAQMAREKVVKSLLGDEPAPAGGDEGDEEEGEAPAADPAEAEG